MKRSTMVAVGLGVVALGAAAFFLFRRSGSTSQPDPMTQVTQSLATPQKTIGSNAYDLGVALFNTVGSLGAAAINKGLLDKAPPKTEEKKTNSPKADTLLSSAP